MLTDTIREVLDNVPPDVDVAMVLDAGNANLAAELGCPLPLPILPEHTPQTIGNLAHRGVSLSRIQNRRHQIAVAARRPFERR